MSEKLIKGTLNIFATVEYCSCGKEVLKSFVLTEDGNVVCSSCLARDWDYMVARIRELEKALEFYGDVENWKVLLNTKGYISNNDRYTHDQLQEAGLGYAAIARKALRR